MITLSSVPGKQRQSHVKGLEAAPFWVDVIVCCALKANGKLKTSSRRDFIVRNIRIDVIQIYNVFFNRTVGLKISCILVISNYNVNILTRTCVGLRIFYLCYVKL